MAVLAIFLEKYRFLNKNTLPLMYNAFIITF